MKTESEDLAGGRDRLLVIEDEASMATAYEDFFTELGYEVVISQTGAAALKRLLEEEFTVVLSDLLLPDCLGLDVFRKLKQARLERVMPVWIMITGHATYDNAVEVIKEGVDHYFVKPIDLGELEVFVARGAENYKTRYQAWLYRRRESKADIQDRLIGRSAPFRDMIALSRTAAASEATILIRGESGTGKELVAELIHTKSPRAKGPFVKVNCAAIPENLLEAELFGFEQGAFTDARHQRKGKFELANGGTIFLDEIGEMSPNLQVKLLRVLQEREVERLGGSRPIALDIRLVAATNRDLEDCIKQGSFREDLYYRINVITIHVPPLRERSRDDILLLVSEFLTRFNAKDNKQFSQISSEAQDMLARYAWPGNVRELENVIERAVVLGSGTELTPSHLPAPLHLPGIRAESADVLDRILDQGLPLEEVERELIRRALARADGNVSQAARILSLTRRTLQYRMEKHNIARAEGSPIR